MSKKVAIQGIAGSFHDIAAHQYFDGETLELVCCDTFEQVFQQMQDEHDVIGVVAIENTIAGSLLHNYELLRDSRMQVVGEHKLRIAHSLLCLPDDDWDDITEVHSHPVALMQCRRFLQQHHGLKIVEAEDTAGAARDIAEHQLHGHAAIASAHSASLYGMKVMEEGIETNKHNFTRFLIVADPLSAPYLCSPDTSNKASLVFSLPHNEGSLSQVLSIFSFYRINLTKIQSLPIIGREWEYMFYVDLTYDSYIRYRQSIDAIRPLTRQLSVLGEYKEWIKPENVI
ncbi:MAG: prephenate dehydratase [Bacteroidaceae bacterium]|nr:prephenate dehydratase [Bacteroidaceae bacterium]